MRKFVFALLAVLACCGLSAQDIIFRQDGSEIQAKVSEVTTSEIVYKKWDNPEGPIFRIKKNEVFMIRFENGTKEMFNNQTRYPEDGRVAIGFYNATSIPYIPDVPLSRKGTMIYAGKILVNPAAALDEDAYKKWSKGVWLDLSAITLYGCAAVGLIACLANELGPDMPAMDGMQQGNMAVAYLVTAGLAGLGVFCDLYGTDLMDKAIKIHNSRNFPDSVAEPSLSIGIQRHGLGFAINF